MNKTELARRIYELSYILGKFTLRSGQISNEYFDKYLFEAEPEILASVAKGMTYLLPNNVEVIAGLELGGIPIATLISNFTSIPTAFVRKKPKKYGTCNIIEGADVKGKNVVIVEDVVTSGGQIILSADELRKQGAVIKSVICVIDREAGGEEVLGKHKLLLRSLFTMSELKGKEVL